MPDVLLAYSVSALLVAIVLVVAFLTGLSMRGASSRTRVLLNLAGGVILAIALLEKAGWSARPWTLGSPAAAFNDLLFRILFLLGFAVLLVSMTAALGTASADR
jgi:hypothetical protein